MPLKNCVRLTEIEYVVGLDHNEPIRMLQQLATITSQDVASLQFVLYHSDDEPTDAEFWNQIDDLLTLQFPGLEKVVVKLEYNTQDDPFGELKHLLPKIYQRGILHELERQAWIRYENQNYSIINSADL